MVPLPPSSAAPDATREPSEACTVPFTVKLSFSVRTLPTAMVPSASTVTPLIRVAPLTYRYSPVSMPFVTCVPSPKYRFSPEAFSLASTALSNFTLASFIVEERVSIRLLFFNSRRFSEDCPVTFRFLPLEMMLPLFTMSA